MSRGSVFLTRRSGRQRRGCRPLPQRCQGADRSRCSARKRAPRATRRNEDPDAGAKSVLFRTAPAARPGGASGLLCSRCDVLPGAGYLARDPGGRNVRGRRPRRMERGSGRRDQPRGTRGLGLGGVDVSSSPDIGKTAHHLGTAPRCSSHVFSRWEEIEATQAGAYHYTEDLEDNELLEFKWPGPML